MIPHTPKPWQLARFDPSTCFIEVETVERGDDVPDQGYFIAKMYAGPDGPTGDNHLVKAAPDLLEALEAFLRAPHIGSDGPGSSTIVVQEFNLKAARAAIAKARGEE